MYLLLFALWLLLNGKITVETVLFGIGITGLLALLCYALFGYTPRKELRLCRKFPLFLAYLAVLAWEILKANVTVFKIILCKRRRIEPALVTVRTEFQTEFARYMLANSITLTPGTITVETAGNDLTVHCLDAKMIQGAETGIFVRLLKKMEA